MRTLLVATEETIGAHAGEEYDDYITVKSIPTPQELPSIANQIRNKIRGVIVAAQAEGCHDEKVVKISLDASPPYSVVLVSLSDVMKQEEGLVLELPKGLGRKDNAVSSADSTTMTGDESGTVQPEDADNEVTS